MKFEGVFRPFIQMSLVKVDCLVRCLVCANFVKHQWKNVKYIAKFVTTFFNKSRRDSVGDLESSNRYVQNQTSVKCYLIQRDEKFNPYFITFIINGVLELNWSKTCFVSGVTQHYKIIKWLTYIRPLCKSIILMNTSSLLILSHL